MLPIHDNHQVLRSFAPVTPFQSAAGGNPDVFSAFPPVGSGNQFDGPTYANTAGASFMSNMNTPYQMTASQYNIDGLLNSNIQAGTAFGNHFPLSGYDSHVFQQGNDIHMVNDIKRNDSTGYGFDAVDNGTNPGLKNYHHSPHMDLYDPSLSPPTSALSKDAEYVNVQHGPQEATVADHNKDDDEEWVEVSPAKKRKRSTTTAVSSQPRKQRDPRKKLFPWTDEDWKLIVLSFVRTLYDDMDMDVPFAAVARNFDPDCNPGALRQAVDKLQKDLVKKGHNLPKLSMNWTDVRKKPRKPRGRSSMMVTLHYTPGNPAFADEAFMADEEGYYAEEE
jgi:hypothetical protein